MTAMKSLPPPIFLSFIRFFSFCRGEENSPGTLSAPGIRDKGFRWDHKGKLRQERKQRHLQAAVKPGDSEPRGEKKNGHDHGHAISGNSSLSFFHLSHIDDRLRMTEFPSSSDVQAFLALIKTNPALYNPEKHDEYTLHRFLVAGGTLDKTMALWKENLQWRDKLGADLLIDGAILTPDRQKRYMHLFPHGLIGADRDFQPILVYRVGKIDGAKLLEEFDDATRIKLHAQMMEFVLSVVFPACSLKAGKRVDRILTIYDLAGVGFSSASYFSPMFTPLIKSQAAHYPDTNFRMYFLNAPFGFQSVFKGAMSLMPPQVQKKIEIYGAGFSKVPAVIAVLDPAVLPEYLGGTEHQRLGDFKGSWSDIHHQVNGLQRKSVVSPGEVQVVTKTAPAPAPASSPFASMPAETYEVKKVFQEMINSEAIGTTEQGVSQALSTLGYQDSFKSCLSFQESRRFSSYLSSPSGRFIPGMGLSDIEEDIGEKLEAPLAGVEEEIEESEEKVMKCITLRGCFWWFR